MTRRRNTAALFLAEITRHVALLMATTALAGVAGLTSAQATEFQVINANDSGAGSLRQAITNANAAGGANTITFASNVGTIQLASNLPLVASSVTIDAMGSTLNGGGTYRGFLVTGVATTSDGTPPAITVGISNLTIQNVVARGGSGADGGGGGLVGELALNAHSILFANFDGEFSGLNQFYSGQGGFKYVW